VWRIVVRVAAITYALLFAVVGLVLWLCGALAGCAVDSAQDRGPATRSSTVNRSPTTARQVASTWPAADIQSGFPPPMCSRSMLVVEQNGPWWRFRADGWPGLQQCGPLVVVWGRDGDPREPIPLPVRTACTDLVIPPRAVEVLNFAFGNRWHYGPDLPPDVVALTAQLLSPQSADWQEPLAVTAVVTWMVVR
jgi:hypothetical protein